MSREDAYNFLEKRFNGISDYKLYDETLLLNNNSMACGTTIITKQVDGIIFINVRDEPKPLS